MEKGKAKSYHLSVPATSANLGPGFDTLGLALDLRMDVLAKPAADWSVITRGQGAENLAQDASNMIAKACIHGLKLFRVEGLAFDLAVDNPIPVSRGLGSSATAIVTGLALAQLAATGTLNRDLLFQQAADYEKHPDNVAPAIYGGLCVCSKAADGSYQREAGEIHPSLRVLLVVPDTKASTAKMRGILPESYSQEVLDANSRDCQTLLKGLAKGEPEALRVSEHDRLHQPYRLNAQPVSKQVFETLAQHSQICGAFLSGSGATIGGWVMGTDPTADVKLQLQALAIDATTDLRLPDKDGLLWEAINV